MRKGKIDKAVKKLNAARGLSYPSIGYLMFADITGNGDNRRKLYVIVNSAGGVDVSSLRGRTNRETLANIEGALAIP